MCGQVKEVSLIQCSLLVDQSCCVVLVVIVLFECLCKCWPPVWFGTVSFVVRYTRLFYFWLSGYSGKSSLTFENTKVAPRGRARRARWLHD
jgi:hypothetical protein